MQRLLTEHDVGIEVGEQDHKDEEHDPPRAVLLVEQLGDRIARPLELRLLQPGEHLRSSCGKTIRALAKIKGIMPAELTPQRNEGRLPAVDLRAAHPPTVLHRDAAMRFWM